MVFTPDCSLSGSNTIGIRVTDQNGESTTYSVAVTVTNPNIATIDSYSPTSNPVVILSSETKSFIVSASGNPPLTYTWSISPGSTIASCQNQTTCSLSGGDFSPGTYVLTVSTSDALATSDSRAFNIVINDRPSISFNSISNAQTLKMNCSSVKNFDLNIEDANLSGGQTLNISWLVNGLPHSSLTNTNDFGVYPVTSSATFSPNCDSGLIGNHSVSAIISDGFESQRLDWNLSINYFSEECNNLGPGEICTIAGLLGQGSNLNVDTHSDELRIRAEFIEKYPSGGFFFSDGYRHAIWFYNDTNSAVNVFGKTIPAKTVKSLFGSTYWGVGTDGQSFNNFYLRSPRGLKYSTSENALYVAEYDNHRVVRFDSNGVGRRWAAGSNSNTDGATRRSHKCRNPVDIELDESENKVFVSCYGNTNNADGAFKYFLTNIDEGYTLLRHRNNTTTEGTIGYNGVARSPRGYSIAKDPSDKILYLGDLARCRIMALSYASDTKSFFGGALNLGAGEMKRILRGGTCGEIINRAWNDTGGRIRPYALEVYQEAGVTKGIFWSQYNRHFIGLLNLTNTAITLGGRTVDAGRYHNIWGRNNTADYGRGEPAFTNTFSRNPFGLLIHNNQLYIGDRGNYRIAGFDLASQDSYDLLGNLFISDYDDEISKASNKRQFTRPRALKFDEATNSILIADSGNRRIRRMDLSSGNITTLIGRGQNGNSNTNPEDPQDAYTNNIGDIHTDENSNYLYYTDYNGGGGTNRNCLLRLHNRTNSVQSLFNQSIPANRVFSIIGNFADGCNPWDSMNYAGASATSIPLDYPIGVASLPDQTKVFLSDYDAHAIYEVNSSGVISEFLGLPNSTGDVSGIFSNVRLNRPGDLELDSNSTFRSRGNFFIVDRWINTNSYIKYLNFGPGDVNIFGLTISAGEIQKIISSDGYIGGVTSFENQICYSQGANASGSQYPHNVICLNRNTGLTTLRVGRISASILKCATPETSEEEGVLASSSSLCSPWGVAFDSDGNLYISDSFANNIRMVRRWF